MTDVILYPTGDTYLWEGSPATNHCNSSYLYIDIVDFECRFFIKFDISSIPSGSTISEAILHIRYYHTGETNDDNGKIRRTTEDFNECGITWGSQPSTTSVNETDIVLDANGDWESYDVTDLLQDACDNSLDYFGMRFVATTGNDEHAFYSSNSDDEPYLTITYASEYDDVYVKLTGDDSNDGSSWDDAKQTIKAGLETVAVNGTLHIAFGDYSSQDAITLDKTVSLLCENEGGGGTGTVVLPPTT